jgi:hypothetical protein
MQFLLAYADSSSSSSSNMLLILFSAVVIPIVGILAFVPVIISWRRAHRHSDAIAALALLWAILLASSVIYTASSQMRWSDERLLRIKSGYFDPKDQTDAPAWPWLNWSGLAVSYCGLLGWSLVRGEPRA